MASSLPSLPEIGYQGTEFLDLVIKPQESKLLPQGIRVEITDAGVITLPSLVKGDGNIYPFGASNGAFQGAANGTLDFVTFVLKTYKKETQTLITKYLPTLKYFLSKREISADAIADSEIEDIEVEMFMSDLNRALVTNFWLADTAKTHSANGTYANGVAFTSGGGDIRINQADGIWKLVAASQSLSGVNKVPYSTMLATDFTSDNELKADVSKKYFDILVKQSNEELKQIAAQDKRIYATREIIENYTDTLSTTATDSGRFALIDGIEVPTFKGIPIVLMPIEDEVALYGFTEKHRMFLSTPDNLVTILGYGDLSIIEAWTEKLTQSRNMRLNFQWAYGYLHANLCSAIKGEYVAPE